MKNYYEILGVSEDASKDNIQKVFRKLALMYHPDVKGGNERKFKEINEAYNILIDDASRSKHDRDLNISPKEKSSFGKSSEPKQSKKESKRYPVENNITLEKWNGFLLSADEVEEYVADGNAVQHSFFADLFSKEKQLDISRRNKRFWELLNKRGVADDPEYFKHHMKAFDEKIVDLIIQPTKKIICS